MTLVSCAATTERKFCVNVVGGKCLSGDDFVNVDLSLPPTQWSDGAVIQCSWVGRGAHATVAILLTFMCLAITVIFVKCVSESCTCLQRRKHHVGQLYHSLDSNETPLGM